MADENAALQTNLESGDIGQQKPLTDLWMHQNNLMWSRVRLLAGLQASALVSNYVLKDRAASFALCVAAAAATAFLIYISDVDREIRDHYRGRLKKLNFKVGLDAGERTIKLDKVFGWPVPKGVTSRLTLWIILCSMIMCDVVVLIVSLAAFR